MARTLPGMSSNEAATAVNVTTAVDIVLLAEAYAVCRLPTGSSLPSELLQYTDAGVVSVTWTSAETSVICREDRVPAGAVFEPGWRCFQVAGPLDLALTGILASIAGPLAEARVNIFAFSTYDTDYVLVPGVRLAAAVAALTSAGHRISES
jgi:uncharacterized protein